MELLIFTEQSGDYIALWPFAAAALIIGLIVIGWRTRNLSYVVCCAVFGVYLLKVIDLTLFPMFIAPRSDEPWYWEQFWRNINLIPFYFGSDAAAYPELMSLAIQGAILNIVLTIPFGFGLRFIVPVSTKRIFWTGLLVGLGIEAAQLIMGLLLRLNYRQIDVNDVIMNALGVWIGYGLFRIFAWFYIWSRAK